MQVLLQDRAGMRRRLPVLFLAVLACVLSAPGLATAKKSKSPKPKLILQITVDQLRGDLPMRYQDRYGPGGFRYLLDKGTHYANAHYRYANTETAVGHATLFTGADPARHGMVANDWFDQRTGQRVYNTEDDRYHEIGHKPKPHEGVSPRNLLASTIGDELVVSNGGQSRVFSVSVKDRGAIIPGGHVGKAFWFSKGNGDFVSSTFYYEKLPAWVTAWNAERPADRYKGKRWDLLQPRDSYVFRDMDDRPYETDFDVLGRTFPHELGDGSSKYFYTLLTFTPGGDELTLDFAKALIANEGIGQGSATDFLAVSFSSTDYIGHLFGPSSLESEDNLLRLDRILAELFRYVDETVGLKNTLIVLSADHGAPEAPEFMASQGLATGRVPFDWFQSDSIRKALRAKFGRDDLIRTYSHPYVYLDLGKIRESKLDVAAVERVVADEAIKLPGIYYAETRSDLLAGRVAGTPIQDQILRNFHPSRSGNIYVVQDQYWFLHSDETAAKIGIAAIHGSPWAYDTYVPIFFAGPGVPKGTVYRRVGPQDIAPTLASYLEIKFPSGSVGDPLVEVLPKRR